MCVALTKRCYRVSNQYLSLHCSLPLHFQLKDREREAAGEKKSEKVMERASDKKREMKL